MEQMIYRSYRQAGTRYANAITKCGRKFPFDFTEGIYMPATPIWTLLTPTDENSEIKFTPAGINDIFGNDNPLYVEIGIGNGEFITHHAMALPDTNWLGFEVYHEVFEKAVSRTRRANLENVRLLQFDAEFFVRMLPLGSVSGFFVNFPDPWPKKKHTKRRLLKSWFIELMRDRLAENAAITVATDHEDYATEIAENFSLVQGLESTLGAPYVNDLGDYYKTKYYRKFAANGKSFFYNMRRV